MNILVLTHRPLYPPVYGYSRVITDTYMAIADKGHRVCIVSIVPKKKVGQKNLDGLDYIELNEPLKVFLKLAITRTLLRLGKGEFLFYHLLWLAKTYASQEVVENTIKIAREHLGEPDVVVAETIYPGFLAEKVAEKLGVKHVVRIHNIEAQYISSLVKLLKKKAVKTIGLLEESVLKKACKIYALSYNDFLTVKTLYGNINAVYIPPILISRTPMQEDVLEKIGIEKNNYYFYIASPHKPNIFFLKKILECWIHIREHGYKLVIGGSISPIARKLLDKYTTKENNIVIAGLLSREEVTAITKNAYVCIAPHHGHGVPIKLVEALQLGVPVITTVNALNTLKGLKNKYNIYAIDNVNELCEAITLLMHDKELYNKIKYGAVEFSKELDHDKLASLFINEIYQIIR
ncbi:glycosyltransferase family 4 protein [Desulfurococcaceae archaeon MEX13E-LK6-19]|nr:glycosyltransferase family 4 protein [Desulfurococcaceae archaeon MEX13E-LK6-19]